LLGLRGMWGATAQEKDEEQYEFEPGGEHRCLWFDGSSWGPGMWVGSGFGRSRGSRAMSRGSRAVEDGVGVAFRGSPEEEKLLRGVPWVHKIGKMHQK
jgi:hypothetical protein